MNRLSETRLSDEEIKKRGDQIMVVVFSHCSII